MNAIRVEGASLFAVATGTGRVRKEIFIYELANPETPVAADSCNPAAEKDRQTLLNQLPEELRAEADPLLRELAAAVAVDAAKPRKSADGKTTDQEAADEPWPDEVDGDALLADVRALLGKYVVLPPYADVAVALWIQHTYLIDVTDFTPYLLISSPLKQCGKSTLLELLSYTAFRAQLTGGITAAALYRRIDRCTPTILLDELDTRLRGEGGESLRGVLDTGFHRTGRVTICVGDNHEDRDFRTYCPKALAGIGKPWDTVTDRSIPLELDRASKAELRKLGKIRGTLIRAECEPYRRRLRRRADDVREYLAEANPAVPDALGARQSDVWRPLLAIADVAGGEWPGLARKAALELHGRAEHEGDWAQLMLEDVRALLDSHGVRWMDGERLICNIASETLAEELKKMEHRPWPEFPPRGQPITQNGIAKLLGRFNTQSGKKLRPKTVQLGKGYGARTAKGYKGAELEPLFERYLAEASEPSEVPNGPLRPSALTPLTDKTETANAFLFDDEDYEREERAGLAEDRW